MRPGQRRPSPRLSADLARLRRDVEALAGIGRTPEGGVSRPAFSEAWEQARRWLADRMRRAGLATRLDAAGNVIGRLGPRGPSVVTGSHIDSVPNGGPLDGALGVLAGLECARAFGEAGLVPPRALEVVAFADEEGRFLDCLGSRAMTGQLGPADVRRAADPEGKPLAAAMRAVGLDPDRVRAAARPAADFAAYVELHIEQGPVLERRGVPIGIVEAIVGIAQADLRFRGRADHAGTTPMTIRRDAFLGAAEFAVRARELVRARGTRHSRLTFGVVEVRPQVPNIVPFEARLRQELRDIAPERLWRLAAGTRRLAARVARRRHLALEWQEVFRHRPVQLAPRLQGLIREVCRDRGLAALRLPSGAGHDAQILAAVTEAGMIFVPSQGGRSHRPDERTAWPALGRGVDVLLHTLHRLLFAPDPRLGRARRSHEEPR
ncbi:MAG TPA: Zn-dependent hydrolase [Methylomirabilota bacterium]|nr:Zn-dependent hydrolase [Methylomirabilota bacterium]